MSAIGGNVYDIIRYAGKIPLDELVLRSSAPPELVAQSIQQLIDEGLVAVHGPLPDNPQDVGLAKDTVVELTSRGFSTAV